jgi:hypothetical protein
VSGGQDPYKLAGQCRPHARFNKYTLTTGFKIYGKADSDLGFIPAKAGFKAFIWNDEFYVMAGAAFAVTSG